MADDPNDTPDFGSLNLDALDLSIGEDTTTADLEKEEAKTNEEETPNPEDPPVPPSGDETEELEEEEKPPVPPEGGNPDADPIPDDPDAEPISLVDEIQKTKFGYEDLEYEKTDDEEANLVNMTKAVAERMAEDRLKQTLGEDTEASRLYDFLKNGGDVRKFVDVNAPTNDFTTMEFNEDNTDQHKSLLRAKLTEEGESKESIDSIIEEFEAGGVLKSQAKRALGYLQREQEAQKEGLIKQQREEQIQRAAQAQQFWDNQKSIIDKSDNFGGLPITEKEKDDFYNFISQADETGFSKFQRKVQELSPEQALAMQLVVYRGLDLSSFVKTATRTSAARTLRDKLTDTKPQTGTGTSRQRAETPGAVDFSNAGSIA